VGERCFIRPAALTGSEAGALCCGRVGVEAHMLTLRPARGAGGPAIDAGGFDGIVEDVVGRAVAPLHGLPTLIVGREGCLVSLGCHGKGHDTLLRASFLTPR